MEKETVSRTWLILKIARYLMHRRKLVTKQRTIHCPIKYYLKRRFRIELPILHENVVLQRFCSLTCLRDRRPNGLKISRFLSNMPVTTFLVLRSGPRCRERLILVWCYWRTAARYRGSNCVSPDCTLGY